MKTAPKPVEERDPIRMADWLQSPDAIVRRWEVWEVALQAAEYQRLARIRRSRVKRALYRLGFFR